MANVESPVGLRRQRRQALLPRGHRPERRPDDDQLARPGAQAYLPTNTLPPVVLPFDPTGTLPLGILTVSNPTMAEQQVKDLARVEVRNRLGAGARRASRRWSSAARTARS